ncbi:hypothetical protein ACHQM5_029979 [Ranunculus cassubicifolius]
MSKILHIYKKIGSFPLSTPKIYFKSTSNHHYHRFFSSFPEFDHKQNPRTVSISVLVRSIVSIVHKTEQWDSLLTRLCLVSSSQITPPIAVQVIKRIKKPNLAFKFFEWLEDVKGFDHDSLTYSAILQVLSKVSKFEFAEIANGLLRKKIDLGYDVSPMDFEFVLKQWVRVGKVGNAYKVFDEMKKRGFVPSCLACNVLLQGLMKGKEKSLGMELFYEMRDGWVDSVDTQSFNSVMKVACIEGRMDDAFDLFNAMKEKDCRPDLDSFNILIQGFSEKGDVSMIGGLFRGMFDLRIKPDSYTMNLLIKELCKQGRPECGNDLFNYMRKVGWIDKKFVYIQLVESLCNYGWWLKALKVFVKMVRKGHHPKVSLYSNLMRRLCMGNRIRQAYRLKDLMEQKAFISSNENYNVLMEGVCLAGRMDMADKLLREFLHKGLDPDLRNWNALLRGHCVQMNVTKAMGILEKIKEKHMVPELRHCNDLINNLMNEKRVEEALQVKSYIQVFQNTSSDLDDPVTPELNT